MSITRISSLNKFRGVLCGRDLAGIFENGHVYQFIKIDGEILCKDLGKHAQSDYIKRGATISLIMHEGIHLLTEPEYEAELKAKAL